MTVAAAPGANQFRVHRHRIEVHGKAKERIETLESDLAHMTCAELAQHGECRIGRSGVADAREVGGKIDVGTHPVRL
jgi:hypothetical protein